MSPYLVAKVPVPQELAPNVPTPTSSCTVQLTWVLSPCLAHPGLPPGDTGAACHCPTLCLPSGCPSPLSITQGASGPQYQGRRGWKCPSPALPCLILKHSTPLGLQCHKNPNPALWCLEGQAGPAGPREAAAQPWWHPSLPQTHCCISPVLFHLPLALPWAALGAHRGRGGGPGSETVPTSRFLKQQLRFGAPWDTMGLTSCESLQGP